MGLKQDLEIRRQILEKYVVVKGNIEKAIQHKQKLIEKAPGIKGATKAGMDI